MKNKISLLVLPLLLLVGCHKKIEPVKLSTPVVNVNEEGEASWAAVENAAKYLVTINGVGSETTALKVNLTPNQSITVKALAGSEEYTDSDDSEAIVFTVNFGMVDPAAGYYNRDADVFVEGTKKYLVYTKNEIKAEEGINEIVAREGTYLFNTDYVYGDEVVLLKAGDSWDQYIGSASVVKGEFTYNNESYSYLMAYCASNQVEANGIVGYQIGFACGKDMKHEFVKVGNEPVITFDTEEYGNMNGCYAPSLVNYDMHSGIRLFYTYAFDFGHFVKYFDADMSNLNNINGVEAFAPNYGNLESGDDKLMIPNADFAYDATNHKFYFVKDYSPSASTRPNFATKIEVGYINEEELYTAEIIEGFSSINVYDFIDLDASRVYCGSFVSNEYGHILNNNSYEIVYNVCLDAEESSNYLFTQKLVSLTGNY